MTAGTNNTYTYNFTPTAYQDYPVVIKATDNKSGVTTLNNTIKIAPVSTNRFIPLPSKIILGYAHSWENTGAPFLYFSQMVGSKFNVVDYSFVETVNRDGYTPVLTTNSNYNLINIVSNSSPFCSQTLNSSAQVIVNPKPVVTATPNTQTICSAR